jgi:hypothetical protein
VQGFLLLWRQVLGSMGYIGMPMSGWRAKHTLQGCTKAGNYRNLSKIR